MVYYESRLLRSGFNKLQRCPGPARRVPGYDLTRDRERVVSCESRLLRSGFNELQRCPGPARRVPGYDLTRDREMATARKNRLLRVTRLIGLVKAVDYDQVNTSSNGFQGPG